MWIPGHKDITGNLYADKIAKKAVDSKSTTAVMMTKGDVGRILREREKITWKAWESRNVKLFLPDKSALNSFLKSTPSVGLCQLMSGHTRLNDFVFRILRLIRSPLCEYAESNETIMHYLLECWLYDELRKEIWTDFQPDLAYVSKDWSKINDFIVRSGRFDRNVRENMMIKSGQNRGV